MRMFIVVDAAERVSDMSKAETCIMCGIIIPEGRQVCPTCEDKVLQKPIKQDFSKQCNMNDDDVRNNKVLGKTLSAEVLKTGRVKSKRDMQIKYSRNRKGLT